MRKLYKGNFTSQHEPKGRGETMKTITKLLTLTTILTTMMSVKQANAQSLKLTNEVSTKNMFYGINFNKDNNTNYAMNRFSAELNKGNITARIWTNYDLNKGEHNETDIVGQYQVGSIPVSADNTTTANLKIGAGHYSFSNSTVVDEDGTVRPMSDIQEVMVDAAVTGEDWDATVSVGKLFGKDSGKGVRINASASKKINITDHIYSNVKAEGYWFNDYFIPYKGLGNVIGTVSTGWKPIPELDLSLSYSHQIPLTNKTEVIKNEGWVTLGASYTIQ